jgi:FimV-like protein
LESQSDLTYYDALEKETMKRIIILALTTLALFSTAVTAEVSHVSINERLFELGEYPKLKVNIISSHKNPNKVQFFLRQSTGEERLVSSSLSHFLVLVTGVDDVVDSEAVLVVKEHRINRWREVTVLNLFSDNPVENVPHTAYTPSPAKVNEKANGAVKTISNSLTTSTAPIGVKLEENCTVDFNGSETLWRIGLRQSKVWGVNTYGAILAIYEANPRAFNKNKINGLKADALLKCPSVAILDKYTDAKAAEKLFDSMY